MEEENVEDLNPEDLEVVISNGSDEIIIRDTQQIGIKDDELKTTEYFLVENEDMGDENQEEEFLTVENDCEDDQEEEYIAVEIQDTNGTVENPKKVIEWNEICRICASGSEQFIPIFIGEGLEHELANKINTYLPLEISEDDTLPQQACYNCAATLISWHEMFKGCLDAQQRLIDVQNKINSKDQYSNGSSIDENLTTVLEPEIVSNGEQQVDVIKNSKQEETEECVEDGENERCVRFEDTEVITIVTTAKQEFLDPLGGIESVAQVESGTGAKYYEATQRRLEVAKAKVIVNGMTLFKCPECPKHLSTSYNYFAHRRVHTKEKLCRCEVCGKGFTASSSLTRHVRDVHHKIKDYKCGFCERRLASRVARDEHQRTHTDERPHVCDTCGKSFRQRASLSVHKRFHSKSFLFECRQCQRGFPRKQDMERHELTHTDQRPYTCKVCSKSFRSSASAIRHRQSHDLVNKHMCDVCGENFVQARYLKSHKKKLHNDD